MACKKIVLALAALCLAVGCLVGLAACKKPCRHVKTVEEIVAQPTCTGTGVKTVRCADCNAIVRNETLNALGHDYTVLEDETSPTCTSAGSQTLKCSRCDSTVTSKSGDKLGHDFSVTVSETASTCVDEGSKVTKCSRCEETQTETLNVNASAHNFGKWTVDVAPTLDNDGMFKRICLYDDSHFETKPIPSLSTEGVYKVEVTENATCTKKGVKTFSNEEYGEYTAEIPALPHTFDPDRDTLCKVCGQKYYSAGLKYDLSADGTYYTVSAGQLTDNHAVIPAIYNGIPVKAIASEGFAYKTGLNAVTIPEYVENIGSGAFNGSGITKVYFNAINCNDFKSKNWVFLVNTDVEVVIGRQVERIPARMFYPLVTTDRTVNVTKLTFEQGSVCKTVGDYAFNKTKLTTLTLPASVQTIGDYAFYNTQLTNLVIGDNVKTLGKSCFGANSKLKEVTFGKNLQSIADDCFNYCLELISVNLSSTKVTAVGCDAFKGCAKLASVALPDTCASIGKQAFYGCSSLTSLALGNGLANVGEQAFANCVSLGSVTLPAALKVLNNGAFENCSALTQINFNAANCGDLSAANAVFFGIGKDGKLKVVFGDTVERIPARLFYCSADTSVLPQIDVLEIGANVKSVGDYAFLGVSINSAVYSGTRFDAIAVGKGNSTLTGAVK